MKLECKVGFHKYLQISLLIVGGLMQGNTIWQYVQKKY